MTTRFTLTLTTSSADGETKAAECAEVAHMLRLTADKIQATQSASGTINNLNGTGTCTYTYSPTASK